MDKNRPSELLNAKKELAFQIEKKEQCAEELIIANKEIISQKAQKDQQYQALIENGNDAVVIFNLEGKPTYVSRSIKRVLGYTEEETMQLGIYKILHPDDREALSNNMAECLQKAGGCIEGHVCRIKHKDGSWKWVEATITNMLHDPAINGIVDNFRDVTGRKLTEEKLINNERKFRGLIENGTDGIVILSAEGNPSYVSPSVSRILGYSEVEAMQLNLFALIHPDDREGTVERMKICLNSPATPLEKITTRVKHKDGSWRWVEATMTNMLRDPAINGIVDNFRDITERKLAEQKLAESEKNLHHVLSSASDSFYVIDRKGYVTLINKAASENMEIAWGKPVTVGTNIFNLIPDESEEPIRSTLVKVFAGEKVEYELHLFIKNLPAWWQVNYSPVKDDTGAIAGAYITTKNITEKKRAEEKLLLNEQEYRKIAEEKQHESARLIEAQAVAKVGSWETDLQTFNIKWSEETYRIFETDSKKLQVTFQAFIDFVHPDDRDKLKTALENSLTSQLNTSVEHRIISGNGTLKHVIENWKIFRDDKGHPIRALGTCQDITDKKIAENKLNSTSQQLETVVADLNKILSSSLDVICTINGNGEFVNVSVASQQVWGYTPEELIGTRFMNLVYHEDADRTSKAAEKILGGIQVPIFENRYVHKNGKIVPILWSVNWDEKLQLMFCIAKDVTEKKKVDEENRFKANLLNTIGQAAIATDMNGVVSYWNKAAENIYGWTSKEAIGKNIIDLTPAQATMEQALEIMEDLKKGHAWSGEFKVQKKDGTNFPALINNSPIYNEDNIFSGIIGISSDITEKKKLEALLDKSNRLAAIGSFEINVENGTVFWSDITKEIREVAPDFIPRLNEGISYFKPGRDKDIITQRVKDCIDKGIAWDDELEITTHKGNNKWVRTIGQGEFVEGKCVKVYGSFQDISARKKAEFETLKAYEEKNIILESIGDAFFAVDKNSIVTYWNNKAELVMSKNRDEVIGKNIWDVFNGLMDTITYKYYQDAIKENKEQHYETFSEGLNKWLEVSAYPSNNGLTGYFRDITERKLAAIELTSLNIKLTKHADDLAASNRELEDFAHVASHDLQEPLRMVTGFLGQIQNKYNDVIDDKGKQYIHFAVDGAKRMRQLILDLLDFSRVGKLEEKEEMIDVSNVVREVILLCQTQIKETKAIIKFQDLPLLRASKSTLRQVFQNLVSNALKYNKKDQVPVISISATETSTVWQFAIKDNGIGIEEEYFKKIFIIFQRLHSKDEYSGTGIGLAVCKKIIENLGGKIWVESEENKGSTFYFTIPKILN